VIDLVIIGCLSIDLQELRQKKGKHKDVQINIIYIQKTQLTGDRTYIRR
jgi:hypothetical protein